MTTEPPPFVRFRAPGDPASKPGEDRVPVYQLALELSATLFTIVNLSAGVERFYLRDQLDKKSTAIPVLVARALATAEMPERRKVFRLARKAVTDCFVILDVLAQRGTVDDAALEATRASSLALVAQLDALTVEPPMQR